MKTFLKSLFLLASCLPIFAAAPHEYSPVFTNLSLISTPGLANRVTSLVGGGVVTNLYTGSLNGLAGTFIWDPNGPISSVDGVDVLDKRIASPVNATHTPGAGTLATATYWYRVSALTALGETVASTETSLALTGPAGINVNWALIPGATGYKVYGRATGAELFIAQVGQVATYLDTGAITPSGAMPATNSTMGVIGTWNRHFIKVFGKSPQSGDLTNDFPNLSLVPIIAAAGPIGSATTVPIITYDAKGRLTTVTSTTISGVAPSGAAGGDLTNDFPNPLVRRIYGADVPIAGALTTGNVLQVNGVSSLTYGPVQLGGGAGYVQGTVQVENGGTEFVTATPNGVLYGNGTGAIQVTAAPGANVVLVGNSGAPSFSAAITVGTSVTTPALIATTSLTTPAITVSGLTASRFVITDTGGLFATDSDFVYTSDTASFTKVLAPTSVSSPSYISTAAIGITPAAGSSVILTTSGGGNFAVVAANPRPSLTATTGTNPAYWTIANTGSTTYLGAESSVAGSEFPGTTAYASVFGSGGATDTQLLTGGTVRMTIKATTGNVGISTTTPLATFAINGSGHVGGDSDPGDGNWLVDGNTTTATLTVSTWAQLDYTTASRVAVINASKQLDSSGTTIVELGYLAGVTSAIQTQFAGKTFVPKYNTGDPNFLTLTGDGDGQLYMNTTTGEKWHWYAAGPYWTP